MKKIVKILILVVIVGAVAGFIYWQYNKRKIVRDSITQAISKKTDSLYYIHYDSSRIDEINGSAAFYNVVLQSDSAQKAQLNSTDSLPNALYNIRIQEVQAAGVDIAGLLQQQNVAAKKIELIKPVIQIINTGADQPKPFSINDTMALYRKILGKFNSIKADVIQITGGQLMITNKAGKPQTTFENINITLNQFLIDSTKNYESIISYFIKDVRATVENIQLPPSKNGSRINLEKIDYNAAKHYLQIGSLKQYLLNNMNAVVDLKNIRVNDLNTDAFILQQRLKAGLISCDGGVATIYTSKKKGNQKVGEQSIELSTDLIDQAQIAGIDLGKTKVIIVDKDNTAKPPFVLEDATFKVTRMMNVNEGTTLNNLINNAEWLFSAGGFSFNTKDKLYKLSVANVMINSAAASVNIKSLSLKPTISEAQFVKQSSHQQDQYNVTFNNISLSGVNVKRLLISKELQVEHAAFQPLIKIFNDRNLPPGGESKLGKYPQQSLLKLDLPVYVHTASINGGSVSYRERAEKSNMVGNVFFENINARLTNITNMPDRIKQNNLMKLTATAKFLGAGNLSTEWQFPMNAGNGAFNIKGSLAGMNAVTLNSIIEPLAMASVKQGNIDGVTFNLDGTDTRAIGKILFLYHDLKMEILKKDDEDELKKKGLVSFFANAIIKNENKNSANTKEINYQRDVTRSFFNLVWKTIFTGAKNTALGKKAKDEVKQ